MLNKIKNLILKLPKFIRFAIVGGINTLIDLGILNLLVAIFGVAQPFLFSIYKGVSFIAALLNSYIMNKKFTFKFESNKKETFYLFVFFSLIGFVVNVTFSSIVFYILSTSLKLNPHLVATISGLTGTLFGLLINYLSYNFFVFNDKKN